MVLSFAETFARKSGAHSRIKANPVNYIANVWEEEEMYGDWDYQVTERTQMMYAMTRLGLRQEVITEYMEWLFSPSNSKPFVARSETEWGYLAIERAYAMASKPANLG